jgi:hypothetical protein
VNAGAVRKAIKPARSIGPKSLEKRQPIGDSAGYRQLSTADAAQFGISLRADKGTTGAAQPGQFRGEQVERPGAAERLIDAPPGSGAA